MSDRKFSKIAKKYNMDLTTYAEMRIMARKRLAKRLKNR